MQPPGLSSASLPPRLSTRSGIPTMNGSTRRFDDTAIPDPTEAVARLGAGVRRVNRLTRCRYWTTLSWRSTSWIRYQSRDARALSLHQDPGSWLGIVSGFRGASLRKRRAAWGFRARIVSDISTFLISKASDRVMRDRPTHGQKFFVPGAGWITFDPTNRSVGGSSDTCRRRARYPAGPFPCRNFVG